MNCINWVLDKNKSLRLSGVWRCEVLIAGCSTAARRAAARGAHKRFAVGQNLGAGRIHSARASAAKKEKECGAFLLNCINWVLDKNKSLRLSEFGGAKF